jgi:Arc/MetJ-type ribon-helix-helix transcriptional regulator
MKEVRIKLSDEQVAAIEAEIAAGEARSISELVALALDAYLTPPDMPSPEEMYRMALEAEAEAEATGEWYTAQEVRQLIRESTDGESGKD